MGINHKNHTLQLLKWLKLKNYQKDWLKIFFKQEFGWLKFRIRLTISSLWSTAAGLFLVVNEWYTLTQTHVTVYAYVQYGSLDWQSSDNTNNSNSGGQL